MASHPVTSIETLQVERLRATLARARNAPHYAERLAGCDVQSLADLPRLPLTTKDDLRAASPWGVVAVPREELFQYHESYGTTGTPVSGWLTRGDLQHYAAQINLSAVDFGSGDRVLVRFPYAISVPAHIVTQAARERGACVVPASSRTAISPYSRVIDLLRKLEVTVLCCLPTEAIWLAEAARRLGRDPARDFPHLRAICTAGELLSDTRRERIAAIWNCHVYNLYGCTEAGNIAADCRDGKLHLASEHFLLEVLDEATWQPVPPGERGVAVLTTLTREAMPLVRFVLGDYVRLHSDRTCPCGQKSPIIEHFGRDLNRFQVPAIPAETPFRVSTMAFTEPRGGTRQAAAPKARSAARGKRPEDTEPVRAARDEVRAWTPPGATTPEPAPGKAEIPAKADLPPAPPAKTEPPANSVPESAAETPANVSASPPPERVWVYVRDLEDRLLTAPAAAVGDLWLIERRGEEVVFRAEASQPDARLYRRLEEDIAAELKIRLRIEAVAPGGLLNRARFDIVEPVNKPRLVGDARPDGQPLTLDDVMPT